MQPSLTPTNKLCPQCEKGYMIEEFVHELDNGVVTHGLVQGLKRVPTGLYCDHCGLRFKFIPKK